ncbi:Holliday junction recognition protein isoform X2 [Aythya fuligula]|uniref:Holliday junction recognition protein isoform X2 n=1 Tax=Aythya fuligula TaxID=219594 RepID=A0A6J3EJH7_AYTFU|nr:Holliday junction recognition protein isoform X2 [Aythya fuligula]
MHKTAKKLLPGLKYNRPFEDDFLISMETLTFDTPDGPKQWGEVSNRSLKKWKKKLLQNHTGSQRNTEMSKQHAGDLEDGHSTVHQDFPESSSVDVSDADVESDADLVTVRKRFEDIHFQNLDVDNVKTPEEVKVQVDVIVQDDSRRIPKWITAAPQGLSEDLHLVSPMPVMIGNQASVFGKKVELTNACSSSRPYQFQFSGVPILPDIVTVPRLQPFQEINKTCYDSVLEEYQSADEECSWSNITLADLYPAMVETLIKLMTKQIQRKAFKYMFGHCRNKRWCPRRPKLNVTVDKIRRFRPLKLKKALPGICSGRKDIQNQTSGNNVNVNSGPCDDQCSINNLSGLVPYSYLDSSGMETDCSNSSVDHHSLFGKGQNVPEWTAFPNVLARMGETFVVEDPLPTTVSLNNLKCNPSDNLAYKCSLEYPFLTATARSDSTALTLVKESETQKIDCPSGNTSGFCSSTCYFNDNSSTFAPVTNHSLAKASNTFVINPQIKISEREISFQRRHSFSSLSMKHSPSKMPQKYEDAFEKLYYKMCSKKIQKPLTLTKPLSNSRKPEERGRLMKYNLSGSVRSNIQYDRAFEKIYEQLSSEAVSKLPGFQRASNLRKYEGIQVSETVNALVNSPVRSLSAIPRVKRLGNFQNDLLCSPVKRLKNIPEHYFFPTKHQQISHRKNANLQTVDVDFLSPYNGSSTSFFNSRNCQNQDSGFHASSDRTFLVSPVISLKESGTADASSWHRTTQHYSCPGSAQKNHQKVSRKLSYGNGKDRNPSNPLDDVVVKSNQGTFMDCYRENIVL